MIPQSLFTTRFLSVNASMKNQGMTPFISSAGRIIDDYLPFQPNPHSPTSSEFYTFYFTKLQKLFQKYYGWYKLRKIDPGFNPNKVAAQVGPDLYTDMMKAIAGGKISNLRDTVTESVFSNLKSHIKKRPKGERHVWELHSLEKPQVYHLVLAAIDAEDRYIAQMSVEFKSKQSYVGYNKNGKKISGDAKKVHDISEIWVMERPYLGKNVNTHWRMAGILQDNQDSKARNPLFKG